MPTPIDTMKWFRDFIAQAEANNDHERMQLAEYIDNALRDRYSDPERGISGLNQGVDLARKLDEPCWEILFKFWISDLYLFSLQDVEKSLEIAIENFTLAHQPMYRNCTVIGQVYVAFINAHYMSDVEGYADKIQAMLEYVEENIRLDQQGTFLLQRYRAYLPATFEQWDADLLMNVMSTICC
jgi:hypothetical protein